jgi:hypothetical protein
MRGRVASGPGGSGGDTCERGAGQHGDWALTGGPRRHSAGALFKLGFKLIQKYSNGSNEIQIPPNFGWLKRYIPALQKFEIK